MGRTRTSLTPTRIETPVLARRAAADARLQLRSYGARRPPIPTSAHRGGRHDAAHEAVLERVEHAQRLRRAPPRASTRARSPRRRARWAARPPSRSCPGDRAHRQEARDVEAKRSASVWNRKALPGSSSAPSTARGCAAATRAGCPSATAASRSGCGAPAPIRVPREAGEAPAGTTKAPPPRHRRGQRPAPTNVPSVAPTTRLGRRGSPTRCRSRGIRAAASSTTTPGAATPARRALLVVVGTAARAAGQRRAAIAEKGARRGQWRRRCAARAPVQGWRAA